MIHIVHPVEPHRGYIAMNQTRTTRSGGQALVVMVLAMLTIVTGLGLIIDGGNAGAQQQITQAGNDAASEAGAMVLTQNLAGATTPAGGSDGAVNTAVTGAASNNGAAVDVAHYTDICGTLLRSDGTKAAGAGDAAVVGAGVLPTNNNTNPDCPAGVVGPVAGVQVAASRQFSTFVSGVIGITGLTANTTATAVSGLLQGSCAAESGCIVLPITVPVTVVTCAGNGNAELTATPWPKNTRIIVPLCKNNPGNVGWLDWTPKGGGAAELEQAILHPNNPPIDLPSWNYVTETGNPNSKKIEDALNTYIGQIVLFPLFDLTCGEDPDLSQTAVGPDYGCGDVGGDWPEPVVPLPGVRRVRAGEGDRQRQQQAGLRHRERRDVVPHRPVRGLHHGRNRGAGHRRRHHRRRRDRDAAHPLTSRATPRGHWRTAVESAAKLARGRAVNWRQLAAAPRPSVRPVRPLATGSSSRRRPRPRPCDPRSGPSGRRRRTSQPPHREPDPRAPSDQHWQRSSSMRTT